MKRFSLLFCLLFVSITTTSQSIARLWNEEVLHGIRNDFARPTVHARNLYHSSVLMYDVWAVFDDTANTFFLGNELGGYTCPFEGFTTTENKEEAQKKAISYAVYQLMKHRFRNSPGKDIIFEEVEGVMDSLGYDRSFENVNYQSGDPRALGNYIAQEMIAYGMQDGSNEANDYVNTYYEAVNEDLNTDIVGNPDIEFPNRWQRLKIENFVDQSGNFILGGTPEFLSPEWGNVVPFSMTDDQKEVFERDGDVYQVYENPGPPSYIQEGLGNEDPYKWGFSMVATWSSHLDSEDGVMIDISPGSLGNVTVDFPTTFDEYKAYYDYLEGGDPGMGWDVNPVTNEPYEPQIVPRGDYARVLAEFWADGPDSETPPGHWFTIFNYVNDQPSLVRKFRGQGKELTPLEWDVKGYFILGGTMHDVAIAAWSNKGYYDYIRPISAIRYMADSGQSSDPTLPNYHPHGIPLVDGLIELVYEDDPMVGAFQENLHKIKLYAWLGPDAIIDPSFSIAGVDWILAEEWFPYQRPSFVTPPFAGYVSGHSTYSRAAAEILTYITGSEFFPGGMGTFEIEKDTFLVFEVGPSQPFQLQWATYTDASDQTSLSRIWGGIHPPIDDIPGRMMGKRIAQRSFDFATKYFEGAQVDNPVLFPNPATFQLSIVYQAQQPLDMVVYDTFGREILRSRADFDINSRAKMDISSLTRGVYILSLQTLDGDSLFSEKWIKD